MADREVQKVEIFQISIAWLASGFLSNSAAHGSG
jgi:hypothetical protein